MSSSTSSPTSASSSILTRTIATQTELNVSHLHHPEITVYSGPLAGKRRQDVERDKKEEEMKEKEEELKEKLEEEAVGGEVDASTADNVALTTPLISHTTTTTTTTTMPLAAAAQVSVPHVVCKQKSGKKKRDDSGYVSAELRPRLLGTTTIKVYHMYDKSRPAVDFDVDNYHLQFQLKPGYLGTPPNTFVYLNPQDPSFFYQQLPAPRFHLWLLIKNTTFKDTGYVKRRLVEEAIKQNIQVTLMNPNKFDLLLQDEVITTAAADGTLNNTSSSSRVRPLRYMQYDGRRVAVPDAVIPRVGANVDYYGLAVMRQLETMGVRVFNKCQAVEIARDKMYTHQVLARHGIPMPRSVLSKLPFDYNYIEHHFQGYPIIVKMASGSKGEAVWKVDSRQELEDLVNSSVYANFLVKHAKKNGIALPATATATTTTTTTSSSTTATNHIMPTDATSVATPTTATDAAPSVSTISTDASTGTDDATTTASSSSTTTSTSAPSSISTTGLAVSTHSSSFDLTKPVIFQDFLRFTKGRDLRCFTIGGRVGAAMMRIAASGFKANVHQGGSVAPVVVQPKLGELAIRTANYCQLDFSGVDLLIDRDTYRVCEVNSSPGFEGLEKACEVNVAKMCIDYARERMEDDERAWLQQRGLQKDSRGFPIHYVPVDPAHLVIA